MLYNTRDLSRNFTVLDPENKFFGTVTLPVLTHLLKY